MNDKKMPIHLACENGSINKVQSLIENNCDIEYEDEWKWRPIHIGCINGHIDIVKLLIKHHCNVECEDIIKRKPIYFACSYGHTNVMKLLIEQHCNFECEYIYKRKPIYIACANGHIDVVKLLIEYNCNIECETDEKIRPIYIACLNGYLNIVQLLIEHGCNFECENETKSRPIHIACKNGHFDIVELLIKQKCNTECEDIIKRRPLHIACENGHKSIVKLLIEYCDIECEDIFKKKPIHIACENGHIDIVKFLIEQNCNIESETEEKIRPFYMACLNGHVDIVKLLIEHHCNIECETNEKIKPVYIACLNGYNDIVKLLIECGCNIECENKEKLRPIHAACLTGNLDMVKLLLEKHCSKECENISGRRPIFFACLNGHIDIVKLLIEHNCNIECETVEKIRPVYIACLNGHIDIVKLLMDKKCNIEYEGRMKERPIHTACRNGRTDIVKLLIAKHCNLECENIFKKTPIHIACEMRHIDIVKLMIEHGCNIESEDESNERPIHVACKNGHFDIVKLLIEHGCDTKCENEAKNRPIHIACEMGHIDIVKLMIEHGCNIESEDESKEFLPDLMKKKNDKDCLELSKLNNIYHCMRENDDHKFEEMYQSHIEAATENDLELPWLEMAERYKANNIIKYLKDKRIDDAELNYLTRVVSKNRNTLISRENILIRCIRDRNAEGFNEYCSADVINGHHKYMLKSFLEYAAECGCRAFINPIMKKTVYCKETWDQAKSASRRNGYDKIVDDITNRELKLDCRLQKNFSLLHTAVSDNDDDMVKYILEENIVDTNTHHDIFGSALALAYSLCHRKCIIVLQQFRYDPNTQNQFSQTPLHEAIASGIFDQCPYLIENSDNIDKAGFNNLTALHCAVLEGRSDLCEQLLNHGADCFRYTDMEHLLLPNPKVEQRSTEQFALSKQENALTLCFKVNQTIYPCFLRILNNENLNCCDASNNSLLHFAAVCLQPHICISLIRAGAKVNQVNKEGKTCLLGLLSSITESRNIDGIIETVNALIQNGADINLSVFHYALRFHNKELIKCLFGHVADNERSPILRDILLITSNITNGVDETNKHKITFDFFLKTKMFSQEIRKHYDMLLTSLIKEKRIIFALELVKQIGYDLSLPSALQAAQEMERTDITDSFFIKLDKKTNDKDIASIKSILMHIMQYEEMCHIALDMQLTCSSSCDHIFCRKSFLSLSFETKLEIGSGKFGMVYQITDSENKFHFAVKVISNSKNTHSRSAKCIEKNINKYRKLMQHVNIVKYFGAVKKRDKLCIFMEYMERGSLETYIDENDPVPIHKIVEFMRQILKGVSFLHSNNIIHRDIKPENVLLDVNEVLKLTDFGLSRSLEQSEQFENNYGKKTASTDCGTSFYKAPEVRMGSYEFSADIWSVGITVAHMLLGKVPSCSLQITQIILEIENSRKEDLNSSLKKKIYKMLDDNPSRRATADSLLTDDDD